MADKQFRFKFVPVNASASVQRAAVLYPLYRKICRPLSTVREATTRTVKAWRARLHRLAAFGWAPSDNPTQRQYVRNCRPAFMPLVDADEPNTSCCIRWFCPFCYARWVGEVWETISAAFPNAYELIERRRSWTACEKDPNYLEETHVAWLRVLMQNEVRRRARRIRKYKPAGLFSFVTVAPAAGGGWRFDLREIYLFVPGKVFPPQFGDETVVTRYANVTMKQLRGIVARTCRYPRGLMVGDPEMMVHLLNARRQKPVSRLAAFVGVFRNSSNGESDVVSL